MPSVQPDPIDDRTPLMLAAQANDPARLVDLILSGEDLDAQDARGYTALTHACHSGFYEVVQQLLDSGADPDVHRSYAMFDTPLSIAAERGYFAIVRLLIAHGANPRIYAGLVAVRPECHARRNGFPEIAQFLRFHEDRAEKVKALRERALW